MLPITDSKGKKVKGPRDTYNEQFKKSAAYQCLTKGHLWPENPQIDSSVLVCKRCSAQIEIDEEEEE